MQIIVQRNRKTQDDIIGSLSLDFNPFTCFTIENLALAIPAGLFSVTFDYSNRFNRIMPHIWVPARDDAARAKGFSDAGIRIHWGNVPSNYEGCIGVGNAVEADAIDQTVDTFNQLFKVISPLTGLQILVNDLPRIPV